MGHKYLENLATYQPPYSFEAPSDERKPEWRVEQAVYGFDSTETWSLDTYFYAWLYERLRMYKEKASEIVNLHFHVFTFKGKEYYQDELIDMMCERIEYYFSEDFDDWDEEDFEKIKEIGEIWAIVLPSMWW